MLYFNMNDRNIQSNDCSVCCCTPVSLRAGEVKLITLNYVEWVVPIMANGGPGLVPTPEIAIEETDACQFPSIDGFASPSVLGAIFNVSKATALNTALTLDLVDDVTPDNNTFEFRMAPVSGPFHGAVTASPLDGADWEYTPAAGFVGFDQFWVSIKDAQGRILIRPVNINVGGAVGIPPKGWGPTAVLGLQIDRSKLKINNHLQQITFPIYLPPSNGSDTVDGCRRYRATIKAYARDCDEQYSRIDCIDVSSARC